MVALSMAELPGTGGQVVLAMGGLDNKIHLYCGGRTGKVFFIPLVNVNVNFSFLYIYMVLMLFLYFYFTYEPSLYVHVS